MAITKVTTAMKTAPTSAEVTAHVTATDTTGIEDDIALLGFRVASNGSLAKYNLVDQTVDDFQDTSGVNSGASTNATRNSSNYYSGTSTPTGGTITTYSTYTVHSFLSGTENFVSGGGTVDILAIGGGGSGNDAGSAAAGGGGAGGFVEFSGTLATGTHSVVIGAGGAAQTTGGALGNNGVDTTFGSIITAQGGGGGGSYSGDSVDRTASTGGGGAYASTATDAGETNTPAYSGSGTNYSYKGGDAWTAGVSNSGGAGGGGAGGAASNATNKNGTAGGSGRANSIRTGVSVTYAGGGGGTSHGGGLVGAGGSGGGGAGVNSGTAVSGTVNTGSGGGGTTSGTSGAGGSGIAVIRYTTGTLDSVGNNMTLVSATTAAQAAPTKGDIVFTYTNGAGTTTLGTDVTAEISADGGSTWTAMTLGAEGSTGSHNIATAHDVTISSTITSPYNMAYRIKTLNQSASKTTRIQAVSLGWS